jgi:hypothetical protein
MHTEDISVDLAQLSPREELGSYEELQFDVCDADIPAGKGELCRSHVTNTCTK